MESNFRSTVLNPRRADEEEWNVDHGHDQNHDRERNTDYDRDHHHPRDNIHPSSPNGRQFHIHHSPLSAPPLNMRSPQANFDRTPPIGHYSPSHQSRPIIPYMSGPPPLPPPPPPPHAPTALPQTLPSMAFYTPSGPPELLTVRDMPGTSNYYDPTTDTMRERPVSSEKNGWTATGSKNHLYHRPDGLNDQRHSQSPYHRPDQPNGDNRNGGYTSSTSIHSPVAHSNQPITPPSKSASLQHPGVRYPTSPTFNNPERPHHLETEPQSHPNTLCTPGRSPAELMALSNILSNTEPVIEIPTKSPLAIPTPTATMGQHAEYPTAQSISLSEDRGDDAKSDVEIIERPLDAPKMEPQDKARMENSEKERKEAKPKVPRKPRASTPHDSPSVSRNSALKRGPHKPDAPSKTGSKRQSNGQPKPKSATPGVKEKKTLATLALMEADPGQFDGLDSDLEAEFVVGRAAKRRCLLEDADLVRHDARRMDLTIRLSRRLDTQADFGRRRFEDGLYGEALDEVRQRELYAEKERKKDMQRKRRREKSMAVTMEQREAALARAQTAEDEAERQKHLRDAERASKKAEQTKLILQRGIKGPTRTVTEHLPETSMSTLSASEMDASKANANANTNSNTKAKLRSGVRPKKSKEQKQAEKDKAEAAQAAIDAGFEPPSKEEPKIRIRLSKSKPKEKFDVEEEDNENANNEETKPRKESKAPKEPKEPKGPKDGKEGKESKAKDKDKKEAGELAERAKYVKGYNQIYEQIWRDLARKDIYKTAKTVVESYNVKSSNLKKTAILAAKEAKRWQLRTTKTAKDQQARAKRVMRDMMTFWKRNEREERDMRKAAEKLEVENQRKEEAERENARQKRKLNFLISQTELYSHFIGKKIKTQEVERSTDNPEVAAGESNDTMASDKMVVDEPTGLATAQATKFANVDFDDEDESHLRAVAAANAQNAIAEARKKAQAFNRLTKGDGSPDMDEEGEMNFQNPTGMGNVDITQPTMINAQLKEYQLKGLNWLVNLYEQGINGILADEMGLGKTIQSISVMAYLAEKYDIWGPFLVVAPASTLHNWEQEIRKFVPEFTILPYWGAAPDRKVLRKFWDRKHTTYKRDAPFHVCITSYQLVVGDVAYFQKMRWQYMILDEAQAIKSSQSSRWKCLLNFHCRNRLLLTGTPIQNNMQELWALLHFIMPTLFDSHDEFSEWFSKDIESHAQSNTKLNEDQLKRLHMILKPFMLRRVKKHVQKELGDKIELDVLCDLTYRQRAYYAGLRNQISIMDLIEKATLGDDNDSGTLMNLVMQFRKVCNHPDLFERADTTSPLSFAFFAETGSFLREGISAKVGYSSRSLIEYQLPRLVWVDDGRLDRVGPHNQRASWHNGALGRMMSIWSPDYIRENISGSDAFSWMRFADSAITDVSKTGNQSLFNRALDQARRSNRLRHMTVMFDRCDDAFTPAHALFLVSERQGRGPLTRATREGVLAALMNVSRQDYVDSGLGRLEQVGRLRATAPPIEIVCASSAAVVERSDVMFNVRIRKTMLGPSLDEERALVAHGVSPLLFPPLSMMVAPDKEKDKFTNISVPSMRRFVTDSGKLAKLDHLLFRLKNEGHRVLLYFQMTRMIDLMEEYLTYRKFKYIRLDGSTKLEDRRDLVADFQSRTDIFIFLLSTRAGGLGINLTAADTVIFYDSDWNPTIDSQAMDRAHRLGQTRQVTVYRLITQGTIEERIRKRALQKEEVQRVVIQGGGASVDFSGRRAPENRNRDIAMWLADDEQAEMIEKREKELLESGEYDKVQKRKGGKRKKTGALAGFDASMGEGGKEFSLDDMYHEGEGHFDDNKVSGTATPLPEADAGSAAKKRRLGLTKRAKTTTQRLAMIDGEVG